MERLNSIRPAKSVAIDETATKLSVKATSIVDSTKYATAIVNVIPPENETYIFEIDKNVYVNEFSPESSYEGIVARYNEYGSERHSYLGFSVENLSGAIERATLKLVAKEDCTTGQQQITLVEDDSWVATEVNWNNKPQATEMFVLFNSPQKDQAVEVDVTELVNKAIENDNYVTFKLSSNDKTKEHHYYYAKGDGDAVEPVLKIQVTEQVKPRQHRSRAM